MMGRKELVIATNNPGKLREMRDLISFRSILSLADIGFDEEIAEPYDSFEENAYAKASIVARFCGKDVLADDSGLCVPALGGDPGVHSAYYGGAPRSDERNKERLLAAMAGVEDRSAYYRAVLCLVQDGVAYYFDGNCAGHIADAPQGTGGFGYDPLFIPVGYAETFGVLPVAVKKSISHRAQAIARLKAFLEEGA